VTGFEPATSCSQSRRSRQAELHPGNSGTATIRIPPVAVSQKVYKDYKKISYTKHVIIAIESSRSIVKSGETINRLILGIHYDNSYIVQAFYITGRFYRYIPEQGIVIAAFAPGDGSYDYRRA
jgi:hypothetical protein